MGLTKLYDQYHMIYFPREYKYIQCNIYLQQNITGKYIEYSHLVFADTVTAAYDINNILTFFI